jgi:hypothetical protein
MSRYYTRHQPRDPHWMCARYSGTCATPNCNNKIKRRDDVFYHPSTKSVYCTECSPAVARQAMADIEDDNWNQQMNVY